MKGEEKQKKPARLPDSGEVPGQDMAGTPRVQVRRVLKAKGLNTKQLSPHMENGLEPGLTWDIAQPTLQAQTEAEKPKNWDLL